MLSSGVDIVYSMDGKLFNLNWLKSKKKTTLISLVQLQYVNDNIISALLENSLQGSLNTFAEVYRRISLSFNLKKSQALYQNIPGQVPDLIRVCGLSVYFSQKFPVGLVFYYQVQEWELFVLFFFSGEFDAGENV
eukprot:g30631.t1